MKTRRLFYPVAGSDRSRKPKRSGYDHTQRLPSTSLLVRNRHRRSSRSRRGTRIPRLAQTEIAVLRKYFGTARRINSTTLAAIGSIASKSMATTAAGGRWRFERLVRFRPGPARRTRSIRETKRNEMGSWRRRLPRRTQGGGRRSLGCRTDQISFLARFASRGSLLQRIRTGRFGRMESRQTTGRVRSPKSGHHRNEDFGKRFHRPFPQRENHPQTGSQNRNERKLTWTSTRT